VSPISLTTRSCVYWLNELTKIDKRFTVYFSAVVLLQVARQISRNGFNDELTDTVTTIFGHISDQCCSVLCLPITELNTSELVEFLQKSAVEHLTTYRQSVARDFGSVATIVTTDFEAMYAYKRGDYQRCLQLSTQNVHALLYAVCMPEIHVSLEFIPLFDGDIVSLLALLLMRDRDCGYKTGYYCITQLTLSLYLMT